MSSKYAFGKTVEMGHAQAVERVTQELAKEGFGVLTEEVAGTRGGAARSNRNHVD